MLFSKPTLHLLTLLTLASAAPVPESSQGFLKRQINGLFASFGSFLGIAQTFDYVIVGGGTGGLAMARRLAEDRRTTVAVIEAGTLYQVAAPLIQATPGGDVVGVGEFFLHL